MCGLTGFLLNSAIEENQAYSHLDRMISTINYRGPDHKGIWSDGKVGLGFARLSIIDLSPCGNQPMSALGGKIQLTFNGEIYNFKSIKKELSELGHQFISKSDSEVILLGYLEWGDKILNKLRGMFAIAIWDERYKRLTLARDRIGKKPLVYSRNEEGIFFGSEIKTILSWPRFKRKANLSAIHSYLSYQYVPAPQTAFEEIKKLPAASKLIVEYDSNGNLKDHKVTRYWELPTTRPKHHSYSERDLVDQLTANLSEAVKIRMIADVPLGAFLSGGVDSSAIVAMMAQHTSKSIKTFSIGFEEDEYDETKYARMVAEQYSTDHHELIVKPDAVSILPRLVHHYNEPFADPSAIPSFYLAELAKKSVTVALNGDGGDEAFLGYGRYSSMFDISRIDSVPRPLREFAAKFLMNLPTPGWRKKRKKRLIERLFPDNQSPQQRYSPTITAFNDDHKKTAYGQALLEFENESALDTLEQYFRHANSLVTGANWADIHTYLPDDLMVKVDIATMAHSLESRSPLLDHVFIEWATSIPEKYLISKKQTKILFKKAMEPFLPKEVLYRPKMGFGCPVDHWLRSDLYEMSHDLLLSEKFLSRGIVKRDFIQRHLQEHIDNKTNHSTRLWSLLMLELWFTTWIDN